MSTEFYFYLIFPLLIKIGRKSIFGLLMTGSVCAALGVTLACLQTDQHSAGGIWFELVYVNPITRILEFCLGMISAYLFHALSEQLVKSVNHCRLFELLAIAGCWFLLVIMPSLDDSSLLSRLPNPASFYLHESGGAFVIAFLIFVLALKKGLLSAVLSTKVSVWLGEISFAIYLTHHLLMSYFMISGLMTHG